MSCDMKSQAEVARTGWARGCSQQGRSFRRHGGGEGLGMCREGLGMSYKLQEGCREGGQGPKRGLDHGRPCSLPRNCTEQTVPALREHARARTHTHMHMLILTALEGTFTSQGNSRQLTALRSKGETHGCRSNNKGSGRKLYVSRTRGKETRVCSRTACALTGRRHHGFGVRS